MRKYIHDVLPRQLEDVRKADYEDTDYYCIAEFDLEGMNDIAELITGADNFELLV